MSFLSIIRLGGFHFKTIMIKTTIIFVVTDFYQRVIFKNTLNTPAKRGTRAISKTHKQNYLDLSNIYNILQ